MCAISSGPRLKILNLSGVKTSQMGMVQMAAVNPSAKL
jgi:hypothetical protein